MGFEPTPFRTGALSQRLRPLGQSVYGIYRAFAIKLCSENGGGGSEGFGALRATGIGLAFAVDELC